MKNSKQGLSVVTVYKSLKYTLTYLLNLTCPLRYWNKMRYCNRMCRRKLLSLSCKSINYSKYKQIHKQYIKISMTKSTNYTIVKIEDSVSNQNIWCEQAHSLHKPKNRTAKVVFWYLGHFMLCWWIKNELFGPDTRQHKAEMKWCERVPNIFLPAKSNGHRKVPLQGTPLVL